MKRIILLCLLAGFLASCGSSRQTSNKTVVKTSRSASPAKKVDKIVSHAKEYVGTKYKFGGTSRKGMDCSGLVYISFKEQDISLPRISRDMAKEGKRINLGQVSEGDLLFFQTNKNRRVINHVGLVVESRRGVIRFIHSTTSKGVIISSLSERYWNEAFVEVRRII